MTISEVLEAQWQGLALTLKVRDEKGAVTEIKVDPSARLALLLHLLGNTPNFPDADRVTFNPIGIATSKTTNVPGHMLHFLLPDRMSVQIYLPPEAIPTLKEKIAALGG